MERRTMLKTLTGLITGAAIPAVADAASGAGGSVTFPLKKSKAEWQQLLPPDAYRVLFEEGTERPGSSALIGEKRDGTFVCAACAQPLFDSHAKYESGTGWPSFCQTLQGGIGTSTDFKLVYPRTEYHCARCGGHQGHIFDDGPAPTGKRYCNNGVSLAFVAAGTPLPPLRT